MAVIKPFRAYRPIPGLASQVASLPYDVMNSDEARKMAQENPYSFLHVIKAEIDLPSTTDSHASEVYKTARDNLDTLMAHGVLEQDQAECLYLYKQIMGDHVQVGLVVCTAVDDYLNGVIKIHEHTRPDKEQDRIRYTDSCDANTGLIFLTYRSQQDVNTIISSWMKTHEPAADFQSDDGIQHTIWTIDNEQVIATLVAAFDRLDSLYVADGHHRTASAAKVGQMRREQHPDYQGDEPFNYFLSVLIPNDQLYIMDYNRVIEDLNGLSDEEFLQRVERSFDIHPQSHAYKPQQPHHFGMYFGGTWYQLVVKPGIYDEYDPIGRLDVTILQNHILSPILGVSDPKTDTRIDFVGGIRGLEELEKRLEDGMRVAFALYPTSISDVMSVADAGKVMPPKSTWFEPKVRSGLFVHTLSKDGESS
ncbi:hypothetical protein CSA56_17365 [candidate division KSB3 bacterium]|uniref:DUF1015 domain-containing protein n=1 Tax=candidate division KSB3 bacterium TaxID=2044937 RepID=A0A2G6K8R3_9BACT|nr:MAG: hypothetical protein CSA56_17365 [candidate division KSB3 bacterium]